MKSTRTKDSLPTVVDPRPRSIADLENRSADVRTKCTNNAEEKKGTHSTIGCKLKAKSSTEKPWRQARPHK